MSKERLTILHCVNTTGEKAFLLIIEMSTRPQASKKLGVNQCLRAARNLKCFSKERADYKGCTNYE
jgi:hypothetical protein